MGIVEKQLSKFELSSGEQFIFEYTSKNDIHIHIDNMQVKMSLKEFRQFINVVLEGHDNLVSYKDDL